MKHAKLLECRRKKIITIPEYIVIYNFFFADFEKFKKNHNVKNLRKLFLTGMRKLRLWSAQKN